MKLKVQFILRPNSSLAVNLKNQTRYYFPNSSSRTYFRVDIPIPTGRNKNGGGVIGPKGSKTYQRNSISHDGAGIILLGSML